jgi:hypothetical protein
MRGEVGIPFLILGIHLATAAVGWFKRRLWGWSVFSGHYLVGATGVSIAGALLIYLLRADVRSAFQ